MLPRLRVPSQLRKQARIWETVDLSTLTTLNGPGLKKLVMMLNFKHTTSVRAWFAAGERWGGVGMVCL